MSATELRLKPGQSPADLLREVTGSKKRQHKFGAVRTGHYASKAEARYAEKLQTLKRAGAILDWIEQVPVWLPGRIRYVIDFAVIDLDGRVRFVEVKGFATREWQHKCRLLAEAHPAIFERLEVIRS